MTDSAFYFVTKDDGALVHSYPDDRRLEPSNRRRQIPEENAILSVRVDSAILSVRRKRDLCPNPICWLAKVEF